MQAQELFKTVYSRLLATNSKLLNRSEVFCMAPWIQLHAQTNGKIAPCCMASVNDGNEIGDLRHDPDLKAAWNSTNMKQLRKNMLEGKKSSLCTNCYSYEEFGKFSERKQYNRDYKRYYSRIGQTAGDGTLPNADVPLIDIRFSNKCNYKCRICDSAYSSLWYDEELKIGKAIQQPSKEMRTASDELTFWSSFKTMMPGVKRLHFAGGEPLFMDEHYKTLEHLIAIGNTDVVLSYNTNLSTLRYKKYDVIELWKKFKKVDVWASLDGMGEKGDYQRKGQKWERIEENIRTLQQECPSVLLGVNMTVSIFNVLDIPAFYRYMVDNKFVAPERMNLYLLFYPHYFTVTHLPPALKEKAIAQFKDLEENYLDKLPDSSNIRNHISSVISYMMSEQGSRQKEFRHWINAVDDVRDEKFASIYPELAEMMDET